MSGPYVIDHGAVRDERLRNAFGAALCAHTPVETSPLVAALAAKPGAWESLHQHDAWDRAHDALVKDVGAPVLYQGPLSSAWGNVLAWALHTLATWTPTKDPHKVRLSAAFVIFSVARPPGHLRPLE